MKDTRWWELVLCIFGAHDYQIEHETQIVCADCGKYNGYVEPAKEEPPPTPEQLFALEVEDYLRYPLDSALSNTTALALAFGEEEETVECWAKGKQLPNREEQQKILQWMKKDIARSMPWGG